MSDVRGNWEEAKELLEAEQAASTAVALRREVELTREEARSKGDAEVNDVAATLGTGTGRSQTTTNHDLLMAKTSGTIAANKMHVKS